MESNKQKIKVAYNKNDCSVAFSDKDDCLDDILNYLQNKQDLKELDEIKQLTDDDFNYQTSDTDVIKSIITDKSVEIKYATENCKNAIETVYLNKQKEEVKFYNEDRVRELYSNLEILDFDKSSEIHIETNAGDKNSCVIGHSINVQIKRNGDEGIDNIKNELAQNRDRSQLVEDVIDILVLNKKMTSKNEHYKLPLNEFVFIANSVMEKIQDKQIEKKTNNNKEEELSEEESNDYVVYLNSENSSMIEGENLRCDNISSINGNNGSDIKKYNKDKNHTGLFSNKDEKYLTEMQDEITKANINKCNKIKHSSQMAESEKIINSIKNNNNNINLSRKEAASHKKQDHAIYVIDVIQEEQKKYKSTNGKEGVKKQIESPKIQPETTTSTKPNQTKKITSKIPKEGYQTREPLRNNMQQPDRETKQQRDERKKEDFNNKVKQQIESRKKGNPTSNIESKAYAQLAKEKEVYYKNVNNKKPQTAMPKKKVGVKK